LSGGIEKLKEGVWVDTLLTKIVRELAVLRINKEKTSHNSFLLPHYWAQKWKL